MEPIHFANDLGEKTVFDYVVKNQILTNQPKSDLNEVIIHLILVFPCFSVWHHPFNILNIGYLKHKLLLLTLHFHQPELQATVISNFIYKWNSQSEGHSALKYTTIYYQKYLGICICGMNVRIKWLMFCCFGMEEEGHLGFQGHWQR